MSRELPLDRRTEELRPVEQQMVHHLVRHGWKDVVHGGMPQRDDLLDGCRLEVVEELSAISSRLIVNPASLKLKRASIAPLIDALREAVGG